MENDVKAILDEIFDHLSFELQGAWNSISSYAERQAKMLAQQAAWIAQSRIAGSLKTDDDLFEFFTEELSDSVENFANTIALQTLLTLEKTWNSIVDILWRYINGALTAVGLSGMPIPVFSDRA